MNVPHSKTESATMKTAAPTVPVTATGTILQSQQAARPLLQGRAAQTLTAFIMAGALSGLVWWCLPVIEEFWQELLGHLLEALARDGVGMIAHPMLPAWAHLNGLAVTATLQPPAMDILGYHMLGALCLALFASWLRAPFRNCLRLLAALHMLLALACVALPGGAPYSVEEHTRCLSLSTEALLLALPVVMACTHYIIEYNLERRVLGTLLVALYLILTLPLKLAVHALLIQTAGGLAEPTLFLVFGPALDIFMVTAIYAWVVTWRHNRG